MRNKELIEIAKKSMENAYVNYSKFRVGAALLAKSGRIYTGCNIENASYSAGICAERVAFSKAISEGEREFTAIAIVGSNGRYTYPCGVCRQFMSEFALDLELIFEEDGNIITYKLNELLPLAFTSF